MTDQPVAQWIHDCETQVAELTRYCTDHNIQVVVAESCTGGRVASALTALPGASQFFDRGFITYSNQAKQDLLGVPADLLDTEGAVSEAVAAAMARGALSNSEATWALATTGVAGPGGGSPDKPVGTVWLGMADGTKDQSAPVIHTRCVHFKGDRQHVQWQAVCFILQWWRLCLA